MCPECESEKRGHAGTHGGRHLLEHHQPDMSRFNMDELLRCCVPQFCKTGEAGQDIFTCRRIFSSLCLTAKIVTILKPKSSWCGREHVDVVMFDNLS
nr:hypothetical protein [Candidatus Electrothrix aestuarii]